MIDELLDYYNRELKFIREEGRAFAKQYPRIATRLRLSAGDTLEDPHVARLVESFALLCARLRLKIDDEFPEVCQSLLQALYPQYVAPIPPISICHFEPTELASENHEGVLIGRGAVVETEEFKGQSCSFRTCFATRVYPIKLTEAQYQKPPFTFPVEPSWSATARAALRIRFRTISDKLPISKMEISKLHLYLGSAESCGNELFETLLRDCVGIGVFSSGCPEGRFISARNIRAIGYADDQALLENDARTSTAYRYLWEYFVSADKFRFVEIDLGSLVADVARDDLDIVFYLSKFNAHIGRELANDTIRVGCTPIINLFRHLPEPIRLTGNQTEYRVVPSYRRPQGMEIYSIDRVTATSSSGGESRDFQPFHMPSHREKSDEPGRYWHMSRRRRLNENLEGDRGTEVYLTIVDLNHRGQTNEEWTLHVQATCLNRDLAAELPSGGGRPYVTLQESTGLIQSTIITPISRTRRPLSRDQYLWRLISHLSLNHLTLTDSTHGAEMLREMLRLYNPTDLDEHRKIIESIQSIKYSRGTARIARMGTDDDSQQASGFCRGLEIELTVDEQRLVGMGVYLFASVLDRFFATFATINSYTRLQVRSIADNQLLYNGLPRAGESQLL